MKTAVSIPDDLFRRADELASRLGKSRSEIYREALADYVARREPGAVTEPPVTCAPASICQPGGADSRLMRGAQPVDGFKVGFLRQLAHGIKLDTNERPSTDV